MFFYLSKLIWPLIAPVNLLLLLALAGIMLGFTRFVRFGRALALLAMAGLLFAGFGPAGTMLARPLEDRFARPASLDGVHLFFPDPWHKARHHKRRLVQPPFIAKLLTHLKPGGYLHCATDWQPYAEQMLQVLSAEPGLVNTAADYAPKHDYRPLTKFERRGLQLGHGVWDLVFRRR